MRNILLLSISVLVIGFSSFSQDIGEKVFSYITENSSVTEVVMISAGLEKKYTGTWFDSMEMKEGFLVFYKGALTHRWNMEKVVFVEQTNSYVRIYLEQVK